MTIKFVAHNSLLPFYLAWELEPNNSNYNLSFSYELEDNKKTTILIENLKKLIKLRAYLRQTFSFEGSKLYINIHEELPPIINFYETTHLEFPNLEKVLVEQPHQLKTQSLIILNIVSIDAGRKYIAIFNIHHILLDGYGIDQLIKDLNQLMSNQLINDESIKIYIDKLAKQPKLKAIEGNDYALINYIELINKTSDEVAFKAFSLQSEIFHDAKILPNRIRDQLEIFSKNNQLSVFNLLLIAFNIFTAKLFDRKILLTQYPVNIRQDKSISGCFVNLVAIRSEYESDETYLSLINNFAEILKLLRHVSKIQLYDILNIGQMPNFSESDIAQLDSLNIEGKSYTAKTYPQIANANFSIKYKNRDNNLYFTCDIWASLFPEYFLKSLLLRFFNFLDKLLSNPNVQCASLDLLFDDERRKILNVFNNTDVKFSREKTLVDLFDEIVERYPNACAVKARNGELTYYELNEKSNELANYLIDNGVQIEDRVCILMDHRLEMIICVLAVLKAGAAYVPISHDTPVQKINYILENCESKFLLTIPYLLPTKISGTKVIDISRISVSQRKYIKPSINSSNLAYVIYTSGTTGKPKGVLLEHRSVVNYVTYLINDNKLGCHSIGSKYAGFGFDASVIEIYPILLSGGKLCLIKDEDKPNCDKVNDFFIDNKVNYAFLPTQFAELFFKLENTTLTHLIVGGDVLRKYISQTYQVTNGYGPTETTVQVTKFVVDKTYKNYPIGKPINNVKCYVVDSSLELIPIGMVGELVIGGVCLARGYMNSANLTNEKFFYKNYGINKNNDSDNRLYRSGDLVRWLPDGNLEYIGRNDSQIKFYGHRIELKEIEVRLEEIPEVEQALVICIENEFQSKTLCAYYTAKMPINDDVFKMKLGNVFINSLIPQYFIFIEKFPINANGKIDRASLPKPNLKTLDREYVAPANEKEYLICEAFSKVLGFDNISVNTDFFDFGGNSIKAITLISSLQSNFNISMTDVFKYRTPQLIAKNASLERDALQQRLKRIAKNYQGPEYIIESNDEIVASLPVFNVEPKKISHVLLTGGTGYLGCNILNQLLVLTNYHVHLLVRASSPFEAYKRINEKFKFYFNKSLDEFYNSRIFVYQSDLEKENLDLSSADYKNLSIKIDSIIHSASLVKHYGQYEKFYLANVQSTVNLLEFSKLTHLKDFHHISTVSVLEAQSSFLSENSKIDYSKDSVIPYIKSKLEAEKQVFEYRAQGINSNIYRVGNLAFISNSFKLQENIRDSSFFYRLKCILNLKLITQAIGLVEISPVDVTAKAVVKLFDKEVSSNRAYHVFNPYVFNMVEFFNENDTIPVECVELNEFINRIIDMLGNHSCQNLIERFLLHQGWYSDRQEYPTMVISQDETRCILKMLNFEWPSLTKETFAQYLDKVDQENIND